MEPGLLTQQEYAAGWRPMSTAPQDGTRFDVLVSKAESEEVMATGLFFGEPLMGSRSIRVLRGEHNHLSSYLIPRGWRMAQQQESA